MHQITFTCETITPLFLAGADGKTPELRPPSIKGAMRFWRAAKEEDMTAGALDLTDLQDLSNLKPSFIPIPYIKP